MAEKFKLVIEVELSRGFTVDQKIDFENMLRKLQSEDGVQRLKIEDFNANLNSPMRLVSVSMPDKIEDGIYIGPINSPIALKSPLFEQTLHIDNNHRYGN